MQPAVSIGLIVTELVINALRHTFPAGRIGGTVTVSCNIVEPRWTLSVSDDGIGSPKGQSFPMKPGQGTTIVEALAKRLDAKLDVAMGPRGTTVSVTHDCLASRLPAA